MASYGEKFILPDITPAPRHPSDSLFFQRGHLEKNLLFGDFVMDHGLSSGLLYIMMRLVMHIVTSVSLLLRK